jgi:hypothetical protein
MTRGERIEDGIACGLIVDRRERSGDGRALLRMGSPPEIILDQPKVTRDDGSQTQLEQAPRKTGWAAGFLWF